MSCLNAFAGESGSASSLLNSCNHASSIGSSDNNSCGSLNSGQWRTGREWIHPDSLADSATPQSLPRDPPSCRAWKRLQSEGPFARRSLASPPCLSRLPFCHGASASTTTCRKSAYSPGWTKSPRNSGPPSMIVTSGVPKYRRHDHWKKRSSECGQVSRCARVPPLFRTTPLQWSPTALGEQLQRFIESNYLRLRDHRSSSRGIGASALPTTHPKRRPSPTRWARWMLRNVQLLGRHATAENYRESAIAAVPGIWCTQHKFSTTFRVITLKKKLYKKLQWVGYFPFFSISNWGFLDPAWPLVG